MAGPFPVGAMPHNVPALLHQQPQPPLPRAPMPQHNSAPAGFPASTPVNTQTYRHPPTPPMDMHRQDPVKIQNVRDREPQIYRAVRLEMLPNASSSGRTRDARYDWEEEDIVHTNHNMPQNLIRDRIEELQNTTKSISKKKQGKSEAIKSQLERAQADLTSQDLDVRFYYKLVQFESQWRTAEDRRPKDDRSVRSTKKHRGHSKRSKSPKMERAVIIAYFKRTPTDGRHGLRPAAVPVPVPVPMSMRQPRQIPQPYAPQPHMGGLPPVTLPQGFTRPTPVVPPMPTPVVVDPRLNGQPQAAAGQHAARPMPQVAAGQQAARPMPQVAAGQQAARPMPQAQPPQQGMFNIAQQSSMPPMKQGSAVHDAAGTQRPAPGPVPRPPPTNFQIRPAPTQGPLPVQNAPPNMASAGPGVPKGAFQTGNRPQKKILIETNQNTRDHGKVYHGSDQDSESSSDGWSEDESEDTRPSSISSDQYSPQHGRGRSPGRTYRDPRGTVIIQSPKHIRKGTEHMLDKRASKPFHPQQVHFGSPDYRYREGSRSPRREHHSQRRHEETRRVEPPRIVQVARQSVRHVPVPSTRRESFERRHSRDDKPLERARFDDVHRERSIRKDNDRFTHLEEDVRRRRELKERRDSWREHDHKYADSESRWSDQKARGYMLQSQPRRSTRYHEGRGVSRGYTD
ncbi:hypothetical protein ACHAPA_002504 [Fusarium lateritium]